MGLKVLFFGLLTTFILAGTLYWINVFAKTYKDDQQTLWTGSVGLVAAATLICYAFVWIWTSVHSLTFYFGAVPLFLSSSFDLITTIELWISPKGYFLTQYLQAKDPIIHNIYVTGFIVLNATLLHVIHLAALVRINNGRSARSLLMLSSTAMEYLLVVLIVSILTTKLTLHPLTLSFIFAFPVWVLQMPGTLKMSREFTLSQKQGSGIISKLLSLVTIPLILAAAGVFVAKALVLSGVKHQLLDIVRVNDPIIFLDDIEKTYPSMATSIWLNVVIGLPLLFISLVHHLKPNKPTYLWEVAVANLGFALAAQVTPVVCSFYFKTPQKLRVNPENITFWILNVIPVLAALIQLTSLIPYRVSLVSTKAKTKKRS